jgi:site-specific DNA-methyltransferase (adenine-specific)
MNYLIKIYSPITSTVLDPFCGSGTTGVAAIQENRNFVGIDLSSHYTEIATRRCAEEELAHRVLPTPLDAL